MSYNLFTIVHTSKIFDFCAISHESTSSKVSSIFTWIMNVAMFCTLSTTAHEFMGNNASNNHAIITTIDAHVSASSTIFHF